MISLVYLSGVFGILTYIFATLGIAGFIFWLIGAGIAWEDDRPTPSKKLLVASSLFLVLTAIIPSKQTMYLLVGLNVAETVNQTPEFEKARKVLNIELDKILKEQK